MASISKSALLCLLSHADANTPPGLKAWSRPPTFGESNGYPALARLGAAGMTVESLDALGLSLQGETLPRLRETQESGGEPAKLPDGEGRRARYYASGHKRAVHYTVNPDTSPSGLRPSTIPNSAKADHLRQWHASIVLAANNAVGDTVEIPPLLTGDGTALGAPARSPRVATASGPFGRFMGLRVLLGTVVADITHALDTADDPGAVEAPRHAFLSWAMSCPTTELDRITADSFDTTTIRVGSPVTFVDGSPALRACAIVAKSSGVELPSCYHVASLVDGVATLDLGAPTRRPVTAKLADLRRYVAPRPATPVDTSSWKPSLDGLAVYEGEEVIVIALLPDGVATVLGAEGESDVAVEFLSAPAA
jgi:hypothetical protein